MDGNHRLLQSPIVLDSDTINRRSRLAASQFGPALHNFKLRIDLASLQEFIGYIIYRTQFRGEVILVAIYLLWTLHQEIRPSLPVLRDNGPDSGYLFVLAFFILAEAHLGDTYYGFASWVKVLNSWLVPEGRPPRGVHQSNEALANVQQDILKLLNYDLDTRLAKPAYPSLLAFLGPHALATLGLQPSGLPLVTPPTLFAAPNPQAPSGHLFHPRPSRANFAGHRSPQYSSTYPSYPQ
ncbi:uncharacterized protein STEHIDRAFT_161036 [Stereum hirsutum FP-91666 SS1]|uniref:uncharacterized protein n=1 Tax=Stereum hirsutum (strain FP-91666) TaxID=721885 RepID=UPI0004449570|nr:uncharacterized protein STEHIDRAFT_161036 [Stereum hirsutum FP-91666 SS1]EIM82499.1 hypothetical protein STEHIDRAFT_161036 [Stereum hirsutum FP-91666 SS1]